MNPNHPTEISTMMPCRIPGSLLLCFVLAASVPGYTQTSAPATPPREFAIIVVESLDRDPEFNREFDCVARVFTDVFSQIPRQMKVTVERLAANTPDHDTELRVFLKGSGFDNYEEFEFRAWITLYDHGTKHDFGIVKFIYYPHLGQAMDDVLDRAIRGVALITARKITPILFPEPPTPKS
jgi:hypothetical protein